MIARKFLIEWSKRRNLIGYPLLLATYLIIVPFNNLNDFMGHVLTAAFLLVPFVLFIFHSGVSAIETSYMTQRCYRYDRGFSGRGSYAPAWRCKRLQNRRRDRYVLVSIDGQSRAELD